MLLGAFDSMNPTSLADIVLVTHALFVSFVVGAFVLTVVGGYRGWAWICNLWFRCAHLAAIGIVVAQSWLDIICPLTIIEMRLRARSGLATYEGSFIEHWLHRILYIDAPGWVFIASYTAFGLLVLWAWIRFPPRRSHTKVIGRT